MMKDFICIPATSVRETILDVKEARCKRDGLHDEGRKVFVVNEVTYSNFEEEHY